MYQLQSIYTYILEEGKTVGSKATVSAFEVLFAYVFMCFKVIDKLLIAAAYPVVLYSIDGCLGVIFIL